MNCAPVCLKPLVPLRSNLDNGAKKIPSGMFQPPLPESLLVVAGFVVAVVVVSPSDHNDKFANGPAVGADQFGDAPPVTDTVEPGAWYTKVLLKLTPVPETLMLPDLMKTKAALLLELEMQLDGSQVACAQPELSVPVFARELNAKEPEGTSMFPSKTTFPPAKATTAPPLTLKFGQETHQFPSGMVTVPLGLHALGPKVAT